MTIDLSNDPKRRLLGEYLVGSRVDARDGPVGKVERVNYERMCIVVATRRWPSRRRHRVPASAIASVDPARRILFVGTSKREIVSGPTDHERAGIDEERET